MRFLWTLGSLLASLAASSRTPFAHTHNGTLQGHYAASYDQDLFLGIPYAQPPIGDLRFARAQPYNTSWTGTRQATAYGPSCVGYGGDDIGYPLSEDCLTLNIVRPACYDYAHEKLPVAIWIHGGGYVMGGSRDRRYNLTFIVDNGVQIGKPFIGVSVNYRLSGWGFLASSQVQEAGVTNLGLRDQRLAFEWVHENIAAFGGDADMVTIWGESAGASSVGTHLIAYGGRDDKLFWAGAMESGGSVSFGALGTMASNQPLYDQVSQAVGCDGSLPCLRNVPFEQLNAAFNTSETSDWAQALDGDFIQDLPSRHLARGEFVKVPIITGTNTDEGTSASPQGIDTDQDLIDAIRKTATNDSSTITALLEAYPNDPCVGIPADEGCTQLPALGAQFRRSAALFGDYTYLAQRRLQAATWARHDLPAYSYRFNVLPNGIPAFIGVTHFQEVAFVFDNTLGLGYDAAHGTVNPFAGQPLSYERVARLMSCSWASFFNERDPNAWRATAGREFEAAARWPLYSAKCAENIVFDANCTAFAEPDTYRAAGMAVFNDRAAEAFHR